MKRTHFDFAYPDFNFDLDTSRVVTPYHTPDDIYVKGEDDDIIEYLEKNNIPMPKFDYSPKIDYMFIEFYLTKKNK